MTKNLLKYLFVAFIFFPLNSQIVEIPLSNASMSLRHYPQEGRNTDPMALINDPFVYDASEPESSVPVQTFQLTTIAQPKVDANPTLSTYHPDFPRVDVDLNWYGVEIDIPQGKAIKYLDIWGRNDGGGADRHRGLVIILENDNVRWVSEKWSGATAASEVPSAFGRFDFSKARVSDNLLSSATRMIVTKDIRSQFMTISEVRLAGDNNTADDDSTLPVLSNVTVGTVFFNSSVTAQLNEDGMIYVVPKGTALTLDALQQNYVKKWMCVADELYTMDLSGVDVGNYVLCGVDLNSNVSISSGEINVVPDIDKPILSFDADTLGLNSWLEFHCNETAMIYMVEEGTAANVSAIAAASKHPMLVKNGSSKVSTYDLDSGSYVLYAIDLAGNISLASESFYVSSRIGKVLKNIPLGKGVVGNFHFYLAKYGVGRYAMEDDFDYNPNRPKLNSPNQCYHINVNDTSNWTGAADDWENCWLKAKFAIPEGETLEALDIWGRKYVSGVGKLVSDEDALMHQNLIITLSDSVNSWSSATWSGVGTAKATGAYGRFEFATAGVEPASLLQTATEVMIQHNEGNDEKIIIAELRLAHASAVIVNAGLDQTVSVSNFVDLDASLSVNAEGANFHWQQIAGPHVVLYDSLLYNPFFASPAENAVIRFELRIDEGKGQLSASSDTVTIYVGTTGLDVSVLESIGIYPNPSSDGFYIDLLQTNSTNVITICNMEGLVVYNTTIAPNQVFLVSPSVFNRSGMYIIHIRNDEGATIRQLIIE